MKWTVGVDVGGTFTDFFALNESSGDLHVRKCPSTPSNPAQAVLDGLVELANSHNLSLDELRHLSHGTTVATNALIQRRGGKVMMLTTAGFGDLIEIGRQTRPADRIFDFRRPKMLKSGILENAQNRDFLNFKNFVNAIYSMNSAANRVLASSGCVLGWLFFSARLVGKLGR